MSLKRQVGPAATELGTAFVGLFVGWIIASLLGSMINDVLAEGPVRTSAGLLLSPVVTAVAAVFYWRVSRLTPLDVEPPPKTSLSRTSLIVVGGVLMALAGSMAIGAVTELLGVQVEEQAMVVKIMEDARTDGPLIPALTLGFSAVLLAPMAEEWLFRGLLFRRLAGAGLPVAYSVSGVAFALIHNNATGFPVYVWLAVVFAATMQLTGRLPAAMAVHLGNNAFVLGVLYWG